MAYTRRRVGVVFLALVLSVLLSACGSQEVILDHQIKTPVLATQPASTPSDILTVVQQQSFSLIGIGDIDPQVTTDDQHTQRLIKFVASRFKKPESVVTRIVHTAQKYARPDFPTAEDILAVIAVESTFNTNARRRGSWGLMQVEAKSHRDLLQGGSLTNIDTNIRVGVSILCEYQDMTKSRSGAIMAYNVGIGSYENGARPRTYLRKVNSEKALLLKS